MDINIRNDVHVVNQHRFVIMEQRARLAYATPSLEQRVRLIGDTNRERKSTFDKTEEILYLPSLMMDVDNTMT